MLPPLPEIDRTAIFLDFDGTLVDFASTPDAVFVPSDIKFLLRQLSTALDGALALVTGRSLASLDSLLGEHTLCAAGCHGGEWRTVIRTNDIPGNTVTAQEGNDVSEVSGISEVSGQGNSAVETGAVDSDGIALSQARAVLTAFLQKHDVQLENKPYSLALHFRHNPTVEKVLDDWLDTSLIKLTELRVIKGKFVREIQLLGVNKGVAVQRFMQQPPFAGRIPVYLGDDVTDEDAFAWVNKVAGMSIKVGSGPTCAIHRLDNFQAVSTWLQQLLRQWPERAQNF